MSYTTNLQHIVFGTKHRKPTINMHNSKALYSFIWSMLQKRKCRLYRIGGIEDHVHMVVDVHPKIAVADLVQDIKSYSSQWMKKSMLFPAFEAWCEGYYAESKDPSDKEGIIQYVKNQVEHHKGEAFLDELKRFYSIRGASWHDKELY